MVSSVNLIQPRVSWEENLSERLSRSRGPVGMSVGMSVGDVLIAGIDGKRPSVEVGGTIACCWALDCTSLYKAS